MTTLLVITAGHTDVQIVKSGCRYELDKRCCGELHDELVRRGFSLVDAPQEKKKEPLKTLPDGNLSVCTPKLDAVLERFGSNLPDAAVIFDTQRTTNRDPRAAGFVLQKRLEERGVRTERFSFLQGEEWLEDHSNELDAIVRRTVVNSIANKISGSIDAIDPKRVVLVTTGGLPHANEVIRELVRLHAVGRAKVESLDVPDGAVAGQADRAVPERLHPATALRARWQALSLIEKNGNLLGAWGTVFHLRDQRGQEWTQVIDWLGRFASALPLPDECNIDVLRHKRKAVRRALRVELALRAGDIPSAVHGTVAFMEAATWDYVLDHFEPVAGEDDWYTLRPGRNEPSSVAQIRANGKKGDDKFEWRHGPLRQVWFKFRYNNPVCFAKEHLLDDRDTVFRSPALKKLICARSSEIRELRNDVAHGEPTEQLMEGAREKMQNAGLWSREDPSTGRVSFLTQKLVQDVLVELGVPNPGRLLEDLLDEVCKRLLTTTS